MLVSNSMFSTPLHEYLIHSLDIDECEELRPCPFRCLNTWGSFHCICPAGGCEQESFQPFKSCAIPNDPKCPCPPGYRLVNNKCYGNETNQLLIQVTNDLIYQVQCTVQLTDTYLIEILSKTLVSFKLTDISPKMAKISKGVC